MTLGTGKVADALLGAAAAGGVATALAIVLEMVFPSLAGGPTSFAGALSALLMALAMVALLTAFTSLVFTIGIVLVGLPVWLTLYRLGHRSRRSAVLSGAILSGATTAILAVDLNGPSGGSASFAAMMVAPGAVAGWVLHRIAYGRS